MKKLGFSLTPEVETGVLNALFAAGPAGSDGREERGLIGLIQRSSGREADRLLLRGIVPQEPEWVSATAAGLMFSPRYFSRALDQAALSKTGGGLIVVHSHFWPDTSSVGSPRPSSFDLSAERTQLHAAAQALSPGSPVAAGIVSPNGAWRVREYAWPRPTTTREACAKRFSPEGGVFRDAVSVRIAGSGRMLQVGSNASSDSPLPATELDSTLRMWGDEGQRRLREIHVGIAGAGGVGSILVEFLARLGVGQLTLVDFDTLGADNLNRSLGASRADVGKLKVEYLADVARRSSPLEGFRVYPVNGSASEAEGLSYLLDCDVILGAADSAAARQVLDHASYSHLIPIVDGGSTFLVDSTTGAVSGMAQVCEAGPGRPCLECQGVYDQDRATIAREARFMQGPNPYIRVPGDDTAALPRAPSVISHNGLVASLMVQRLLRIVLQGPPTKGVGQQRFYLEQGEVMWTLVEKCREGCPKSSWVALGDAHSLPVGVDPIRQAMEKRHFNPPRRSK